MPSAIANTHPLKLKDGIDEKNAPMVHPKESVAPYPIKIPPNVDCKYLYLFFGALILNSPDIIEATKDPNITPNVIIKDEFTNDSLEEVQPPNSFKLLTVSLLISPILVNGIVMT